MTLDVFESVIWRHAFMLASQRRDERQAGMGAILSAAERYRTDGCPDYGATFAVAEVVRRRAQVACRDWPDVTAARRAAILREVWSQDGRPGSAQTAQPASWRDAGHITEGANSR